MRFMILVNSSPESEAGELPSTELLTEMGKYNEELVKAGVLLAGEGLHPSSKGARVRFSGSDRTVIDGPFTEAKELVGGFAILEARSKEHAIELAKEFLAVAGGGECEIRQIYTGQPGEAACVEQPGVAVAS